jgi:hypothetical protein
MFTIPVQRLRTDNVVEKKFSISLIFVGYEAFNICRFQTPLQRKML